MKEFEKKIRKYLNERGWDKLRPADLSKSISIEAAELLENFQWDNQTLDQVKNNPEKLENIKKELADVMIYCFDLAVLLDLDIQAILNHKLEKAIEKYPKDLFNIAKNAEDPGTEEEYWKIKKEHRRSE